MAFTHTATIFAKCSKIFFNIIVMVLYRNGDEGYFMGGSFNVDPDIESFCCGIYVGYLLYNIVTLICTVLDSRSVHQAITETLMNGVGTILWLICGGVVIHFWLLYSASNQYIIMHPQRLGIIMGLLTVVNSLFFAADTIFSYQNYKHLER